jgi:hypothetical protein
MSEDHSNSKHIFQNCLNFKDWKQHKLSAPIILGELQLGYLITTLLVFRQCVQFNAHHNNSRQRQRIKTAKEMFHSDSHVSDPATCGTSFKNFNYKHESLNHIQCKTRSNRQLGSLNIDINDPACIRIAAIHFQQIQPWSYWLDFCRHQIALKYQ